jgi:Cache 3/Cache 2 fusion domain
MIRKSFLLGTLASACFIASSCMWMPGAGNAQADPRVATSIANLKAMAAKLGAPKLEGREAVGGKDAPALYFGSTKINNDFGVVDAVSKEDGKGMTATFFVMSGDEYIRISTSVPKPDGSGRAIGTILDPAGKAIAEIRQGKPYYGEVTILGTPYITGYEPMKDGRGSVIGIYYVGYKK